ncbi:hypothetical protein [Corallococcus llansteffanensis]|uniref:Transporter n=1 Tax=Corallococcus llansteffanensis TaxID=2316731 RepID=A0A3A8PT86_9BACT|nr:hypothetical protein [Corallococcus llansteffanensis]RKH56925.1 hypothetical protein D7V93_19320 [Corallococcus llansteffanensis]
MMPRFSCLFMLWLATSGASSWAEEPVTVPPEAPPSRGWFENPTRSRSIVSPTALPLHAGEGFIGQQALFITTAEVGLSERLSLNVASVLPVTLAVGYSDVHFNLLAGLKVTLPLTERLHLAFGVQGGKFNNDLPGVGDINGVAAYGILTYGTGDAYVSLTVQPIFTWEPRDHSGRTMVLPMLGGFVRLGEHWGIAGDVALSPVTGVSEPFAFATAGGRLLGQRWSVDLGLLAGKQLRAYDGLSVVPGASFLFHWR